jgi:hypothetical protein
MLRACRRRRIWAEPMGHGGRDAAPRVSVRFASSASQRWPASQRRYQHTPASAHARVSALCSARRRHLPPVSAPASDSGRSASSHAPCQRTLRVSARKSQRRSVSAFPASSHAPFQRPHVEAPALSKRALQVRRHRLCTRFVSASLGVGARPTSVPTRFGTRSASASAVVTLTRFCRASAPKALAPMVLRPLSW